MTAAQDNALKALGAELRRLRELETALKAVEIAGSSEEVAEHHE